MRFAVVAIMGFVLLCLVHAAGCASPSLAANMVPASVSVQHRYAGSVKTTVAGGQETNGMDASKISDGAFKEALDTTITKAGVFSGLAQDGADWSLEVVITNLGQPMFGLDMTTTLTTNWKLVKKGSTAPAWQDFVSTKCTKTMGDAFAGITRLRLANEGAAQANIREGLERLSKSGVQ